MSEIQIAKTLLILKANNNSTVAAEQFLRNREWVIYSATNLKDFLTFIIQKKPSFVMISVDHPSKKVLMLPKVLAQSFPVCVFAFAEQSSSVSFRKLQDVHTPYRINPPATGPAIERMVNKYLRDQEKKLKDLAEKPSVDATGKPLATGDSKTVIQSGATGEGGSFTTEGGGWNQAASVFSQLLEGDDSAKTDKTGSDGSDGVSGSITSRGDKAESNNGSWIPSEGDNSKNSNQAGTIAGSGNSKHGGIGGDYSNDEGAGFLNGQQNDDGSFEGSQEGTAGTMGSASQKGQKGSQNSSKQNGNGNGSGGAGYLGNAGSADSSSEQNGGQSGQLNGSQGKNKKAGHFGGGDYASDENDSDSQSAGQAGSFKKNSGSGTDAGSESNSGEGNAGTLGGKHNGKKGSNDNQQNYNEDDFDDDGQPRKLGKDGKSIQVGKNKNQNKDKAKAGEGEDTPVGNLRAPNKYTKEQKIHTVMGKKFGAESFDSIILKGTKQALDETVEILDGEVNQQLEDSSQVACIVVESEKFNGYLIAALGKNRKMDGNFIKAIQDRLFKFLKDNGEKVSDKENMNLKIKKVEFEDWAVEYADFLKKSVHNGEEIAMAFFPVSNVRPEVGESAAATMASVKLSEMEGDKTVEFNMYLYMPTNKKYILYTPKGGKFYNNQKGRLEEKGIKEVHMLKSEVNDLSKYKAQNYLNNLIDNYKKKKADHKAA